MSTIRNWSSQLTSFSSQDSVYNDTISWWSSSYLNELHAAFTHVKMLDWCNVTRRKVRALEHARPEMIPVQVQLPQRRLDANRRQRFRYGKETAPRAVDNATEYVAEAGARTPNHVVSARTATDADDHRKKVRGYTKETRHRRHAKVPVLPVWSVTPMLSKVNTCRSLISWFGYGEWRRVRRNVSSCGPPIFNTLVTSTLDSRNSSISLHQTSDVTRLAIHLASTRGDRTANVLLVTVL